MDMDGGYLISLKQFYTEPSRLWLFNYAESLTVTPSMIGINLH